MCQICALAARYRKLSKSSSQILNSGNSSVLPTVKQQKYEREVHFEKTMLLRSLQR